MALVEAAAGAVAVVAAGAVMRAVPQAGDHQAACDAPWHACPGQQDARVRSHELMQVETEKLLNLPG